MPVFLQTWNIFVLDGEQQIHSLTLPRVERMLSLFPFPTFTFPPFFGGNEFISHNAALAWGEALPGITQY